MTTKETKEAAQDRIIAHIVNAALAEAEQGSADIAREIRRQGAMIAKRWGIKNVPGLPDMY